MTISIEEHINKIDEKKWEERAKYIRSQPITEALDCLLRENKKIENLSLFEIKFLARLSFNYPENQNKISKLYSVDAFIGRLETLNNQNDTDEAEVAQKIEYVLDILTNLTGENSNKHEANYTTTSGSKLNILPLKSLDNLSSYRLYSEEYNRFIRLFLNIDFRNKLKKNVAKRYTAKLIYNLSFGLRAEYLNSDSLGILDELAKSSKDSYCQQYAQSTVDYNNVLSNQFMQSLTEQLNKFQSNLLKKLKDNVHQMKASQICDKIHTMFLMYLKDKQTATKENLDEFMRQFDQLLVKEQNAFKSTPWIWFDVIKPALLALLGSVVTIVTLPVRAFLPSVANYANSFFIKPDLLKNESDALKCGIKYIVDNKDSEHGQHL